MVSFIYNYNGLIKILKKKILTLWSDEYVPKFPKLEQRFLISFQPLQLQMIKSKKILTLWSRECVRKSSVLHSTSVTLWLWLKLKLLSPFAAQWLKRSPLFDLDSESPEEKLEQRFPILFQPYK